MRLVACPHMHASAQARWKQPGSGQKPPPISRTAPANAGSSVCTHRWWSCSPLAHGEVAQPTQAAPRCAGFLVFSLKPGTHSATFARLADCIRLPPLPRARHQGGEQEVALAALFYSRGPPSGPTPSPPPSSHNFNPLKDLRDLQQIGLAANKYYRVHAPEFQEQYGLPAGSPGYLHSPMLASGQLHRRLRLEGLGTNPTTSLRGPPPPESLSGWRGEGEEGPPDLSLAQILNGRGGGESSPDFIGTWGVHHWDGGNWG